MCNFCAEIHLGNEVRSTFVNVFLMLPLLALTSICDDIYNICVNLVSGNLAAYKQGTRQAVGTSWWVQSESEIPTRVLRNNSEVRLYCQPELSGVWLALDDYQT